MTPPRAVLGIRSTSEPERIGTTTPRMLAPLKQVVGTTGYDADGARAERPPLDPFVGRSAAIRHLEQHARDALGSRSPILIAGETGTGKGVLATWLHRHSAHAREPFVDLNCAGFSRELMDSELFGHEKGAFTGAVTRKPGLVEVADGGTLFLDEIGDMDVAVQAKLLKVIEERRFRRVGEVHERRADLRIIAATHHDLLRRVQQGLFREDLYFRLFVLPLRVPPLRLRRADILLLAACIIGRLADELGRDEPALTPAAGEALLSRAWPGNLRELRNELERAMLSCGDGPIDAAHLETTAGDIAPVACGPTVAGTDGTLREVMRAFIQRVFDEESQHPERTAQRLGIGRSTLYQKLREYGIALHK